MGPIRWVIALWALLLTVLGALSAGSYLGSGVRQSRQATTSVRSMNERNQRDASAVFALLK